MNRLLNLRFVRMLSIEIPKDIPPHRMAEIEEEEKSEFYKHPDYNCENEKWTEGDEYTKREDKN